MKTETIKLTPELAAKLLADATANRNPSRNTVDAYARDMTAGSWILNGETIKINSRGQMFDGMHRCLAVVQSEATIEVLVVYDAEEANVDGGRVRSYADVLTISGLPNARNYAAVIKAVAGWESGQRMGHNYVLTFQEKEEARLAYPEIADIVRRMYDIRKQVPAAPSVMGLAFWLFQRIDSEDAHAFFEHLAAGAELADNSPVLALRNRLFRERIARRGPLDEKITLALFITAWNAFHAHRPMMKLQLPVPLTPKNFPEPR